MSVMPLAGTGRQGGHARPTPPDADGARLVHRARGGDAPAFEQLYERHVDAVHRFVYVRVRDAAVARDVTQDVFLTALRSLPNLRDDGRFLPWLLRIAHGTVVDHWRRTGRGPRLVSLDAATEAGDGPFAGVDLPLDHLTLAPDAGVDADPERAAARTLDADALMAAIAQLTDLQQHVVTLRYIAELSVADTAEAVGCSEDAVKKLQRRGLASLRRRLEAGNRR